MLRSYSYSSLKTFQNCPRHFKFSYIEKPPMPKQVAPETYVGNAVHRVLQTLYRMGSDGVLMPRDDAVAAYHAEWAKLDRKTITLSKDYYTVDDYIAVGEKQLLKHYDRYQPFDQGTLLGTEMHVNFEIPNTDFKIRGFIDKLWRRDDGVVEICDYKTGQYLPQPTDTPFRYQMGIYQLAVQAGYPQFEDIELVQYFLRHDETVRGRMNGDELDELTEDIRQTIFAVLDAHRLDAFEPKEGNHCHYCDYVDLCPAKRHGRILEGEVADDTKAAADLEVLADRYVLKNEEIKAAKAELARLREDIIDAARSHNLSKLVGNTGEVKVSLTHSEKFVTKTDNAGSFAELSHLARQFELDDYFTLDGRALMKDIYRKKHLAQEQLEQLAPFVIEKEDCRITSKTIQDDAIKDPDR